MRSELEKVRKMLRATEMFVADDFSSSLEALRQSLATYTEVTLGKLHDERNGSTAPAGTPTALRSIQPFIPIWIWLGGASSLVSLGR